MILSQLEDENTAEVKMKNTINVNVRARTINTWVGGTFMLIQCEDHIQCKRNNVAVELKRYIYINLYTYLYLYKYTRRVNSQDGLRKRGQKKTGLRDIV